MRIEVNGNVLTRPFLLGLDDKAIEDKVSGLVQASQ